MRYILTFLFMFSSAVVAQEAYQETLSNGWGVYGGIQSMQISGAEDDASDEELDSYSSDRLSSFYIGVWKNTDWTIGTLPVTIGAELGHRGTSSHSIEEDSDEGATGELAFDVDILITYLDLWASVNYKMSDKFNLWVGPMIGINIKDKATFNGDLSSWDVSSVTDMKYMFFQANAFNKPIGNWDVSNVTDMGVMFYLATSFNQPIENWNTSNVTDMGGMFQSAGVFNQPIGNWDVSNVTNMSFMFSSSVFNQDISSWDVGKVTDMYGMFSSSIFNQEINNWNVSNVTTMGRLFYNATFFNQDISNWDVSSVTEMNNMFLGTAAAYNPFNQDITFWDVSSVIDMNGMFGSSVFNQDISNWDVSNVIDMSNMFIFTSYFNQDLSSWNVSNVSECIGFSYEASAWTLTQPIFTNCTP